MVSYQDIFPRIEDELQKVVPNAQIMLFGSRMRGDYSDESDWDILILTDEQVTPQLKRRLHDQVFPLSVDIGSFINTITVEKEQWLHNPSWYTLRQTISKGFNG